MKFCQNWMWDGTSSHIFGPNVNANAFLRIRSYAPGHKVLYYKTRTNHTHISTME